jgi:hypothetical protein
MIKRLPNSNLNELIAHKSASSKAATVLLQILLLGGNILDYEVIIY